MSARKDTPLRRWRRSVKKIGLLAVLAGLAPALSADSPLPRRTPRRTRRRVGGIRPFPPCRTAFYIPIICKISPCRRKTPPSSAASTEVLRWKTAPLCWNPSPTAFPPAFAKRRNPSPFVSGGLGWAIDSRRPEVTPALAAGGWRLANWLGKEVLLAATDKYGIQTLEFDLQSELGGRRAAIGVNALGALRQTERNAIAWQLSGF